MAPDGTRLRITRPPGVWRDTMRSYTIVVDGQKRGRIRRGESIEVTVEPGKHVVRATIDWAGSPEVEITCHPSETLEMHVEPTGDAFQFLQAFKPHGYLSLTALPIPPGEPSQPR